ncbi:alkaline phosphatase family protein [Niveispirillum sp. BGYR6]|uniref:alkaline phosphatase family protein n=1 Tax=Niveispirillum sp. BGYR6 TaxID=2971249 RepID=UPI0022B9B97C|nr:alkaline phosphatase family protein [Niveispirillum sp. BGYR6]MDG5497478.1 alkaline phosphatase family protein [Niveispirillum sp. BGYR6]
MSRVLPQIEHVVFLMLENRSFDNLLGWLYEGEDRPKHIIASPKQKDEPFHGLEHNKYFNLRPGDPPSLHYVRYGASHYNSPSTDPHEPHQHVTVQLFDLPHDYQGQPKHGEPATMGGFLNDYYYSHIGHLAPACDEPDPVGSLARALSKKMTPELSLEIMDAFTPQQLPVINGLAKAYAVSDQWFSSVPTQTMANRAYSICGSSLAKLNGELVELVDNHGLLFGVVPGKYHAKSIWETLHEHGHRDTKDWMIYYQTKEMNGFCLTRNAFKIPDADKHVTHIDEFFRAVERDELPSFSYLEPNWYNVLPPYQNGNSYHPPSNVLPGEVFLKELYDALTRNTKLWQKTLLIITFDEHGGTYDHFPPPWGAIPPWGTGRAPHKCEQDFGFDRFGVRVPTLLISPWIDEATVFRSTTDVPYDHTSLIATILKWKGIPKDKWDMGERVYHAPTFEGVLTRATPRRDLPKIEVSEDEWAHLAALEASTHCPVTPMQLKFLPFVLRHLCDDTLDEAGLLQALADILKDAECAADLNARVKDFGARYGKV